MKKYFISVLLVFGLTGAKAQISPQYDFNSEYDFSWLFYSEDGDYVVYWNITFTLFLNNDLNNKEKLKLYHRLYEIERTSIIGYQTVDGTPLNLHSERDTMHLGRPVDFGATLVENDKSGNIIKMFFSSPVTRIDPIIFDSSVTYIKLPSSRNLHYDKSPAVNVANLAGMEGKDVIDNRALVNSNKELIVAAVAGLSTYSVPDNVAIIGEGAFRGCTLKTIVLPESVTRIDDVAFEHCANLDTIYILSPEPIQISSTAFDSDKKHKYKIYVPEQCYKAYRKMYPELKKRFEEID